MSRIPVLISPEAGRGSTRRAAAEVLAALRAQGAEPVDVTGASREASLAHLRQEVAAGCSRVVVVGGDGIVHLAVQAVAGTDTALGIIAAGTANDFSRAIFAQELGIDAAVTRALGDTRPLDAIRVNDRWVASVATTGFSAAVNERANRMARPRGQSRYTVATVRELPRMRCVATTITVDGSSFHYQAGMVAVANTAWFGGGMEICPGADPTDGMLDVTVVADVSRRELLWFLRLVFDGRHVTHPKVHTHRGQHIALQAEGLRLWGDGEPVGQGAVSLQLVPGALSVAGA